MQNQLPANRLQSDSFLIPIEQAVSEHIGRVWKVKHFRDMNEFASHPCAILSDGSFSVFAKLSEVANGLEQFETELDGLRFLSEHSGVLIPSVVRNVSVNGGVIMVMEEAQAVERTSRQWREIGQALA
ncbi:MAG: fructosamine kinase family protein, partial [Chloroflexi bacterium]|nr:fructosamine kinase family protein [Chloroflexota bacterium]